MLYKSFCSMLVVAVVALGGCQSTGRVSEGDKSIESFQSVRGSLDKSQTEVDKVLASLNELSSGSNLETAYKNYVKNVAALKSSADAAKARSESMRKNFDAYVTRWQNEMETVKDPAVKSSLEQRKQTVRNNFDEVRDAGQDVREAYEPFMSHLTDIQTALSVDLSQGQVAGLKSSFSKAQDEGALLKKEIADLQDELDKIYSGLSASGSSS